MTRHQGASRRVLPVRVVALLAVAVLLATGCIGLEQKERELTFRATRSEPGWYAGLPAGVVEVDLPVDSPEGPRIHAWWWPDESPGAPIVYYLHGAHWNLTGHLNRIAQLRRFGFSVFAIDYRGFGKSDGDLPSEASVYEDARAGWRWVVAREPDPARRYIYGHSLGGAVAIDLAASLGATDGAHGLVVESSFTNFAEMASVVTRGILPAAMLSQKFDSLAKIGRVPMPVLIVHGQGDRFVPVRFSEALYAAAPAPKRLLIVPNGSHNNSLSIGNSEYHRTLVDFFGLEGAGAAPAHVDAPAPATVAGARG
jgi:alpha-beta hydrolase superfamily lysophospholipase